jgi:hypothetical protein
MKVLSKKVLEEILSDLEKSVNNLAKDAFGNLEIEGGFEGIENFLKNQYDLRLENLLLAKNSSIHHLESELKNEIIQKKQIVFEKMSKQYKN